MHTLFTLNSLAVDLTVMSAGNAGKTVLGHPAGLQEQAAALESLARIHDGGVLLGSVDMEHLLVQRTQVHRCVLTIASRKELQIHVLNSLWCPMTR